MPSCVRCSSPIPASARFCPRCGEERVAVVSTLKRHPMKVGIPWPAIAFFLAILIAPVAVFAGLYFHVPAVLWLGLIVSAAIVLVIVLAHFC